MTRVAALGERSRIQGFALAGLLIIPAENPTEVRRAWTGLATDIGAVLVTRAAWTALGEPTDTGDRLVAVLP